MNRKPKWQLDFETQLSLTNNEDLLANYVDWDNVVNKNALSNRMNKYYKLVREEVLARMEPWSLAKGSFDPMGN
jgi:hypothetical protein